jgi:hypothetical protein
MHSHAFTNALSEGFLLYKSCRLPQMHIFIVHTKMAELVGKGTMFHFTTENQDSAAVCEIQELVCKRSHRRAYANM